MCPTPLWRWAVGDTHTMPWHLIQGRIWTEQTRRCWRPGPLSSRAWFSRGPSCLRELTHPLTGYCWTTGAEEWVLKACATVHLLIPQGHILQSILRNQERWEQFGPRGADPRSSSGKQNEQFLRIETVLKGMSCLFADENYFIFFLILSGSF